MKIFIFIFLAISYITMGKSFGQEQFKAGNQWTYLSTHYNFNFGSLDVDSTIEQIHITSSNPPNGGKVIFSAIVFDSSYYPISTATHKIDTCQCIADSTSIIVRHHSSTDTGWAKEPLDNLRTPKSDSIGCLMYQNSPHVIFCDNPSPDTLAYKSGDRAYRINGIGLLYCTAGISTPKTAYISTKYLLLFNGLPLNGEKFLDGLYAPHTGTRFTKTGISEKHPLSTIIQGNSLVIDFGSRTPDCTHFSVFDLKGRRLQEIDVFPFIGNRLTIPLSHISSGPVLVRLRQLNNTYTFPVLHY